MFLSVIGNTSSVKEIINFSQKFNYLKRIAMLLATEKCSYCVFGVLT